MIAFLLCSVNLHPIGKNLRYLELIFGRKSDDKTDYISVWKVIKYTIKSDDRVAISKTESEYLLGNNHVKYLFIRVLLYTQSSS